MRDFTAHVRVMSFFVNKSRCFALLALSLAAAPAAISQVNPGDAPHTPDMPPMDMPAMNMPDTNAAGMFLMNLASGTSANPAAWPMPMVMAHLGSWNTMFMANAFLADIQQSGPRGGDKLYSTNWFMASAEHRVASHGAFEAVLMLSLQP